mmetsp:Transcript_17492/g.40231  ORF Transcript_17492/g.40231 Transcript_17492/m.40231 type:complete len:192 (+) Transcript_17492:1637-2212(+)
MDASRATPIKGLGTTAPEAAPETAAPPEPPKPNRPKPVRQNSRFGFPMRASSNNDVTEPSEVEDPMHQSLVKRFGNFYGDVVQSFLMTQGVLNEDDLMVRDDLKMLATAKTVGVKPVQLAKLKEWMKELKALGDGPVRPMLPHEREGSKLKLKKQPSSQSGKDYDAASRSSQRSMSRTVSRDVSSNEDFSL